MSGSERQAGGQGGSSRRGSSTSSGAAADGPGDEARSVSAGSYWQDPLAIDMSRSAVPAPRVRRALRAVYVINETVSPQCQDNLSLRCLQEACEDAHAVVETVSFGRLVLGETGTLDCFYNADIAVVEMSDPYCQPSLFYHLGVRESFSMTNNVVLCCDSNLTSLQSLQDIICQRNMGCYGNYIFIPYIVTPSGKVFCCEASMMKCLTEMFQPHFNLEPLLMPLVDRLTKLLEETQINSCEYFRESIQNEIRKARETYRGQELRDALARIQQRLDSVELLSADVVMNLLLSYRDVQDLDATIKLVETLQKLPTCNVAELPNIKFHYCFALNRRNQPGDRERALSVILPVVMTGKQISSDLYCLCGRIYKDIFISSDFTDYESRDKSCYWYGMAFEHEPTLHSGINVAVFLMAAGHQFDTSPELRKIGMKLSSLLGRKGSLEKMQFYWDVGFFLGASILFNDQTKIIQASEKLYRLNAPVWYLASAMETYLLYRRFKTDTKEQPLAKQDLVDFWMEFLLSICRDKAPADKFLVLILEPTKIFQPTHLTVSSTDKDKAVSMCHVSPAEENGIHTWTFSAASIRGVSVSKCNERCCFLYVLHNFDDFQLYFPTELHCKRFCELLNSFTEESQLQVDDALRVTEELLEYKYEYTENGERLILGKGTYGIVYAGRDMNNQVRIAIKEIPERDNRYSQPLHEEIALHKRLKHRNIVQYLGSVSQDGYIKIFMEEVPGGSLSALLCSKWGPLKDNEATIIFYTRQILEGLKYLHDNQIVHRDIKGDNVLINTYSGLLKISDFGTSKRLAGINPCTETFTGTLQYMAPEIIDKGPRGYGKPADIWSLACTVIEMATGKPPFFELGEPQAAMFKVGMFKIHPEIPESMSLEAKAFLLHGFEPNPDKRATAAELLKDPFLSRKKTKPAPKPGEFYHSLSVPALGHLKEGGESRQPLDFKLSSPFLSRSCSIPGLSAKSNSPKQEFLSVLEEQVDDFSAPSSPEENAGLFLLKKDSERRDALFKILTEDCETVVQNVLEAQARNPDSRLTSEHTRQLVTCLKDYIRTPDHKLIVKVLLNLQTKLHFDKAVLNEIQIIIFSFQDAVIKLLRRNQIKPHWMFALDNIIRKAMQVAFSILIPESKHQIQRSFDQEADEHCTDNVPGKWSGSESDVREREVLELQMDGAGTSGVSTLSRSMSHDSQQNTCPLIVQLSQLRAESNRLLEDLAEKEREFQQLLQLTLHQKDHSLKSLRKRSESSDVYSAALCNFRSTTADSETEELTRWLVTTQVDQRTIDQIVANGYTLQDLLTDATRDDLKYAQIRGGMLCRLWAAICSHRKMNGKM
ncbi:mitogen-activated protein kinase kinase kinase 5-like isoform X1 [Chiloscyllium plagiosum]|uniref:mitogen-activated protein kinase kinase kinase 5-like isoform X1 n=1 Tax=Chiloscyllium plagiosum TaxID=36176 RepID=UPI001CB8015E|nr:mitogen-activated protein kinase kinase kinase 5-like isoform X1 [Chiloscyllium plagiosum]